VNWRPEKTRLPRKRKLSDVEVCEGDGIPDNRFVLYALDEKIDMWALADCVTKTTWFLKKAKADGRVLEILKQEKWP